MPRCIQRWLRIIVASRGVIGVLRSGVVLTGLALLAPSAAAAETVVNFDNLFPGTQVTNQYAGTVFGGSLGAPVARQPAAGIAQSAPNVADIRTVCDVDRPIGGDLTAKFASPHASVSAYVGNQDGVAYPDNTVTLTGFDSGGRVLTSNSSGMLRGGVHNLLGISDSAGRIASVEISQQATQSGACSAAVDDFTFSDTVSPPPPPDFSLSAQCPPACPDVSVQPGNSVNVPVLVTRNAQSSGPIAFGFTGGPPGVTATLNPDSLGGSGDGTVTLTVTAAPAAAPTSSVPLEIAGTPQVASAGTATRNTAVRVSVLGTYDAIAEGLEVNQGAQYSREDTPLSAGLTQPGLNPQPDPMSPLFPLWNLSFGVPGLTLDGLRAESTQAGDLLGQNGPPGPANYEGVSLVDGRRTLVTLYADFTGNIPGNSLAGANAELDGTRGGQTLPGSPLPATLPGGLPGPLPRATGPGVSYADRIGRVGAFVFVLPQSWTHGNIQLTAKLTPPPSVTLTGQAATECGGCTANNTFQLNNVGFTRVDSPDVVPVVLDNSECGGFPPPPADQVFAHAIDATPVPIKVAPYWGTIPACDAQTILRQAYAEPTLFEPFFGTTSDDVEKNMTRAVDSSLLDALDEWNDDSDLSNFSDERIIIGVQHITAVDAASGKTSTLRSIERDSGGRDRTQQGVAVVNWERPLTSVAHELQHALFRHHASGGCGASDTSNGAFESWPNDEQGFLDGIGLDQLDGDQVVAEKGPGGEIPPPVDGVTPAVAFDLMSYCAPNPESYPSIETGGDSCLIGPACIAWISPRGWQELVNGWFTFGAAGNRRVAARARDSRAKTPMLHVSGFLLGKRLVILDVFPTRHVIPDDQGTRGYSLIALDAAGHVRARRPLQLLFGHIDPDPGQPALPIVSARGSLPAAGVAKVEFVDHGHVDDSIRRPASPPHVRLLTQRHRRIRSGRFVVIRWTPRARPSHGIALLRNPLTVMIDFSRDGGRHYRTLLLGRSTGRVKLRRKLFGHTKNGRLRIRVSDGFRVGMAVSPRLFT